MSHRPNRRPLVRALVESRRRLMRENRAMEAMAAKQPKATKAQREFDAAVRRELTALGNDARRTEVAMAMQRQEVAVAFRAARDAHGPYVGAQGYEELRTTLLGVLHELGIDTAGVMLRFLWDGKGNLGTEVVADPASRKVAEDAVRARAAQ